MLDGPKKAGGSPVRPASAERRRHPRYPFTAAAEAVELQSEMRIKARTSDLSRGGCYLDTINPFPVGTLVKLRLTKGKNSLESQAAVVSSHVGMGMALKFTTAEPEQLWILEKWLGELSGELPQQSDAPEQEEQASPEESKKEDQYYVLNELITTLMRKGVLTEAEAKAMLRKFPR